MPAGDRRAEPSPQGEGSGRQAAEAPAGVGDRPGGQADSPSSERPQQQGHASQSRGAWASPLSAAGFRRGALYGFCMAASDAAAAIATERLLFELVGGSCRWQVFEEAGPEGVQLAQHACDGAVFKIGRTEDAGLSWTEDGERTSILAITDFAPDEIVAWAVDETYRHATANGSPDDALTQDLDRLMTASAALGKAMSVAAAERRNAASRADR